jgi:hypothetical protein
MYGLQPMLGAKRDITGTRRQLAAALVTSSGFVLLALALVGVGPAGATSLQPPGVPVVAASPVLPSPPWAKHLGTSVTILGPTKATVGNGSAAEAFAGDTEALAKGDILLGCQYIEPSLQRVCRKANSGTTSSVPYTETIKHFAIGYVAVEGTKALVGYTGTFCISDEKPRCMTNSNPAAILSSPKSFTELWSQSVADESVDANRYALGPCVEIGGKWYFYLNPNF